MRKFLVLGILVLSLAFAANAIVRRGVSNQQEQQEQGQPVSFNLFGITWDAAAVQTLGYFSDLGVSIVKVWAKDRSGVAGVAEILLIVDVQDATKRMVLGGRIRVGQADEQGFVRWEREASLPPIGPWFMTGKKQEAGEWLEWRGYDDPNGDPILEFYTINTGGPTGGAAIKSIVRTINIKKFVEEHFKTPEK